MEKLSLSKNEDAKVGHKTYYTSFFGYKTHIAMTQKRIITAATVTSSEKHDGKQLKSLVKKSIDAGMKVTAIIRDADMYVCNQGHISIKKISTRPKKHEKDGSGTVISYFFDVEKYKLCAKRKGCYRDGAKTKSYSVSIKNSSHQKHMDFQESEYFKHKSKERYKIEAKNSELKYRHGYDKASSSGIFGMEIQGAVTIFAVNMKRIISMIG